MSTERVLKTGRPKIAPAIEAEVRKRLLRGETQAMIRDALKIGNVPITRIRAELQASADVRRGAALQEILTSLLAGGMQRERAIELIYTATGTHLT